MNKTYKVWEFVFIGDGEYEKRDINTIAVGKSWQEAKKIRNQNKGSEISPEPLTK